jgi:hypothetical protein
MGQRFSRRRRSKTNKTINPIEELHSNRKIQLLEKLDELQNALDDTKDGFVQLKKPLPNIIIDEL